MWKLRTGVNNQSAYQQCKMQVEGFAGPGWTESQRKHKVNFFLSGLSCEIRFFVLNLRQKYLPKIFCFLIFNVVNLSSSEGPSAALHLNRSEKSSVINQLEKVS